MMKYYLKGLKKDDNETLCDMKEKCIINLNDYLRKSKNISDYVESLEWLTLDNMKWFKTRVMEKK